MRGFVLIAVARQGFDWRYDLKLLGTGLDIQIAEFLSGAEHVALKAAYELVVIIDCGAEAAADDPQMI